MSQTNPIPTHAGLQVSTHSQLVNNHTMQAAVEVPHHGKSAEGGSLGHCFPASYHLAMQKHGPREEQGHQQREILANRKQSMLWEHTCSFSDGINTASKMPGPGKCLIESSAPQRSLKWQAAVTASSLHEMPVMPNLGCSAANTSPAEIPQRQLPVGLWPLPPVQDRTWSGRQTSFQEPKPCLSSLFPSRSPEDFSCKGARG